MAKFFLDLYHGNLFKGDKVVWMIYFLLCMISLVEVYSASSRLTFDSAQHWGPMISQAGFMLLGTFVIYIVHNIPCKWFMLLPFVFLPFSVCLLLWAVCGGGGELNGTNRWIYIAGISVQPSEIAKMSLIMSAAVVLAKTQTEKVIMKHGKERVVVGAMKGKRYTAFATVGIMTCIICGLIFLDNISTAAMLFLVVAIMMFLAHVPLDLMFKGIVGLGVILTVYLATLLTLPSESRVKAPMGKRLDTLISRVDRKMDSGASQRTESEQIKYLLNDKNSQETYARIAVANSNVIGMGPGNSVQRDFLQHAESDFIFAIIIEELGIFGCVFVVFLYLTLLIRVGKIAQRCRRFFPAYLILGFGIMMMLQAMVNMSVAVGLIPVTGQTLPLISKGGSSLIITCFYIGVILSVSRYAYSDERPKVKPAVDYTGETQEYLTEGTME